MFSMISIGTVRSPYQDTSAVPRGLGARHETDGVLEILPEFEAGLRHRGLLPPLRDLGFDRVRRFPS